MWHDSFAVFLQTFWRIILFKVVEIILQCRIQSSLHKKTWASSCQPPPRDSFPATPHSWYLTPQHPQDMHHGHPKLQAASWHKLSTCSSPGIPLLTPTPGDPPGEPGQSFGNYLVSSPLVRWFLACPYSGYSDHVWLPYVPVLLTSF